MARAASYSYSGNNTTITDAAGKWKTRTVDGSGNLITVTEPDPLNPATATFVTNYTYNSANQLTQVSMPRYGYTQTRTFQYTGQDLTTATNPENGTVQYQYDGAHHVTRKIDNGGNQIVNSYDAYGRLTSTQHFVLASRWWSQSGYCLEDDSSEDVQYIYDTNTLDSTGYSQNTWGRLAAVIFGPSTPPWYTALAYMYSYNGAGRVTGKRLMISGTQQGQIPANLDTTYYWDNQGRLQWIWYPLDGTYDGHTSPTYTSSFDAMGRLSQLTVIGGITAASATYTAAGQLATLTEGSLTETRTYDPAMLQLTRITTTRPAVGNSASFVKTDSTTQGTWKGVYGANGSAVAGDQNNYPSYAQVNMSGQGEYTWTSSTSDVRALQYTSQSGRLAATWYASTTFSIDVNLTDGNAHQVALYCLDWDNYLGGRVEQIQVVDASSGAILDTRSVSSFWSGEYLVWNVSGHVTLKITNTGNPNGNSVVSGIFFDSAASGGNVTAMDMQYTYTAGQNNGRITQAKDWVLGQTSNYTYDALNRLSTESIVETGMGEQMSYDGFGNVTGMNGAAVWTHDAATNRVNVAGWTYDKNGNVLTDPNGSYTWNVNGQMTNGGRLYDPDGKLVKDQAGLYYIRWTGRSSGRTV